jgi:peptidoglycan-N-acetylglucosamine deacetylase
MFLLLILVSFGGYYQKQHLTMPSLVREPGTYYMVKTQEKVVALTFDDGPDPLYTGYVLDVLKAKNIKATFFILGVNAKNNPELLKRIGNEGHEIGNHGYSHSYTSSQFIRELERTDEVVFQVLQQHTQFYRPPGGIVSKSVIEEVKERGHILTLWSIDSKDWRNPGSAAIVQNVLKSSFPGGIILLHDGGEKREQTVQALSKIIDQLIQQGYRFVTLSQLRNYENINYTADIITK